MKKIRWFDYLTFNINYLGLTTRSQVLAPLLIPLLVQQFVGEETKGAAVGTIRLWALMTALLAQALFGLISDRSMHRWGRRRPFIFGGAILELCVFVLIGFAAQLFEGTTGYIVIFALYVLSMFSSNLGHAATQGLIPDLVPDEKKGVFSGIKSLFELPIPVILVSFLIAPMVAQNNIWGALVTTALVLLVCMAITMFVPEKPQITSLSPLDWKPFLNLILMTGLFTIIILGVGAVVKRSGVIFTTMPWLHALIGLVGMSVAVIFGVGFSVRVGLGNIEAGNRKPFTRWVMNRLAFMAALTNLSTFMIYFLQEKFNFVKEAAAAPASQIMMVVGVFVLVLAIPTGWLADRVGKTLLLVISGVIACLGTAIIIFFPGMMAVMIGALLIGCGAGTFYSANWAFGTALVPKEHAGKFLGVQNLAGAGAGAIGAYIGGPIGDQLGYIILFGIFGCLFLLSSLVMVGVAQPEKNKITA